MFLQRLDDTEKRRFLALAMKMMDVDGIFKGYEAHYLNFLKAEAGNVRSANMKPAAKIRDEAERMFGDADHVVKMTICLEILVIAHIDAELGQKEIDFVNELAEGMGLSRDDLSSLLTPAADLARAYFRARAALK